MNAEARQQTRCNWTWNATVKQWQTDCGCNRPEIDLRWPYCPECDRKIDIVERATQTERQP
ncbi:MAG: hypothetical protein ACLFNT_15405 [Spirochaetales bacterium]